MTAEEVFDSYYQTVVGTMEASGAKGEYRWHAGKDVFPADGSQWGYMSPSTCDSDDLGRLKMNAEVRVEQSDDRFRSRVEDVRRYWEDQGFKVNNVGSVSFNEKISTRDRYGSVITFSSGRGGFSVTATTRCLQAFNKEAIEKERAAGRY